MQLSDLELWHYAVGGGVLLLIIVGTIVSCWKKGCCCCRKRQQAMLWDDIARMESNSAQPQETLPAYGEDVENPRVAQQTRPNPLHDMGLGPAPAGGMQAPPLPIAEDTDDGLI